MLNGLETYRSAWEDVRARLGFEGEFAAFERHLESNGVAPNSEQHAADLVLAWACGVGHPAAMREFEDTLVPVAERAIARIEARREFVDDCLQRLRTRLLMAAAEGDSPRILGYAGKGPLAGWVSVAAVRVALSVLRQSRRQIAREESLLSEAVLFPVGVSPDLQHLKMRYAGQLGEGVRKAVEELPARERAVLRLYFLEGLNIDKIGKIYGVHRATIARWIARTKSSLMERVHTIMMEDNDVPREELESIDRLVRSQLDISLAGLLS